MATTTAGPATTRAGSAITGAALSDGPGPGTAGLPGAPRGIGADYVQVMANTNDSNQPKVDDADGGPGSHTEDGTGGSANDVASGGTDDNGKSPTDADTDTSEQNERDVHGDPDTVA